MLSLDNKKDVVTWIDTVSHVENLEKEAVKKALEEALATGIRKDFSKDTVLNVSIDSHGEATLFKEWVVVDDNEENFINDHHIYEDIAQENFDENLKIGDVYLQPVDDYNFKRINATIVRQLLKARLKEAHNQKLKDAIRNKKGQLLMVNIKKYDRNGYTVEYNNEVTGFLPYENLFSSSEKLRVGNNYFVVLDDLEKTFKNYSIVFTRNSDDFVKNVFAREIPEISDEVIEIKSIAREKNNKIIVAVHSGDQKIDVIGSCVGSRGVRIQSISKHFNGEKVEIIQWNPDTIEMLQEVVDFEIVKLVIEERIITMVVSDEDFENIEKDELESTLSSLLHIQLSIINETNFNEKEAVENKMHVEHLMNSMNLDQDSAIYLTELGLASIDDIYTSSIDELVELDLTEEDSEAIKAAAVEAVKERAEFIKSKDTDLVNLKYVNDYMIEVLLNNDVLTTEDLADLSTFELMDLIPIESDLASKVILEARETWTV